MSQSAELDNSQANSQAHWFLAAAKPKQELRAIEHLENQGIRCFCPQVKVERIIRGKKVIKQEALFTGYLFINLTSQDPNWHKVRSTRGIRDWVRFSGQVAKLPEALVNSLMHEQEPDQPELIINCIAEGESVRILTGPFAGLSAVYDKDDGDMRSMILVEFLGKTNRLSVDNEQIIVE